jgi:MinD superfamily P-loop ATPase
VIVSVASGKGGTGKTLVATSLALALRGTGRVQFLDCNVEEPNAHIFLKPTINRRETVYIPVPQVDRAKCTYCGKCAEVCAYHAIAVSQPSVLVFPELCCGCGVCSYLCPEEAISEAGREIGVVQTGYSDGVDFIQGRLHMGEAMASSVVAKVKEQAGREGTVIIDVAPGTSCPVVAAIKGSDFCLLVTEPTPFGLNNLASAIDVVRKLNIPCGVVLNRAGVSDKRVEEYCRKEDIPGLLSIPLENRIASFYSRGIPLVEGMPEWRQNFLKLWGKVREVVFARSR